MRQVIDAAVRDFVKSELPPVATRFGNKIDLDDQFALQDIYEADDLASVATRYFLRFHIQPNRFFLGNYFPWQAPTPLCRQPINKNKKPLTINMFIKSAKAGYWLYD